MRNKYKNNFGFSYIEVLIAIALLNVAVLAIANMTFKSQKFGQTLYYQSVAQTQLNSMIDRIRANPEHIAEELILWNYYNKLLLPNGEGKLFNHNKTIELKWFDKNNHQWQSNRTEIF